ncbi:MAG: hypothetical protein HWQ35_18875 [Nostoc sp. NMS1]|nr:MULTISPECIES: hypothetical protein [unclassified Nostoc]MBN3908527.1 hypothetical protein [Nostoc sp. NMS1]MBN3994263.1 hypothetical protein [Nostoc sp. NMS2]
MGNAQCPKRRGDYHGTPTLGMEFPVASDERYLLVLGTLYLPPDLTGRG